MLNSLAEQVSLWLGRWNAGSNFAAIRRAWIERAGPLGEPITINTVQGPVSGTYQGLSETGALRAEVNGECANSATAMWRWAGLPRAMGLHERTRQATSRGGTKQIRRTRVHGARRSRRDRHERLSLRFRSARTPGHG